MGMGYVEILVELGPMPTRSSLASDAACDIFLANEAICFSVFLSRILYLHLTHQHQRSLHAQKHAVRLCDDFKAAALGRATGRSGTPVVAQI